MNAKEVADHVGVTPATLKRWVDTGVIPESPDGDEWPAAAVAHARIVARMRERGHSLREIRGAVRDGRMAFGSVEELLPSGTPLKTPAAYDRRGEISPMA